MSSAPDPGRHSGDAADGAAPDSRSLSEMRDEVIAALGRLADGTFARCDVCGVQISDRRLRLAPAANRCPDHLLLHPDRRPERDGRPESDDDGNDDERTLP